MDADTERAAIKWQRDNALWELGRVGKCWVCGARTPERLPDGRNRCPGCTGEGWTTEQDGSRFTAKMPGSTGQGEPPKKVTPVGVLPNWWARMPACKAEREARTVAVADGRRPEIDPSVLMPPDKMRKIRTGLQAAGWEVWTAYCPGAGVGGRDRILMVAYRGNEMVVAPWDLAVNGTWKAGRTSFWRGRYPDVDMAVTAAIKRMTGVIEA